MSSLMLKVFFTRVMWMVDYRFYRLFISFILACYIILKFSQSNNLAGYLR